MNLIPFVGMADVSIYADESYAEQSSLATKFGESVIEMMDHRSSSF